MRRVLAAVAGVVAAAAVGACAGPPQTPAVALPTVAPPTSTTSTTSPPSTTAAPSTRPTPAPVVSTPRRTVQSQPGRVKDGDAPAVVAAPPAAPRPRATQPSKPSKSAAPVRFANCAEARAAKAAPLHRGEPGYRAALDRDGDGVACEK